MSQDPAGNPSQEYFDTEHLTAALGSRTARGGAVTIVSHGLKFALSIVATAILFVFGGLAVQHEALLKRQMRFYALSLIAFTSMMIGYVVGIFFAWRGARYWSLVFSQLALLASNSLGVWLVCRWRPGRPKRNAGVRSMLSFGGNVTGYALINYISKNCDNLIVGRAFGAQLLGLYSKATQLLSLP